MSVEVSIRMDPVIRPSGTPTGSPNVAGGEEVRLGPINLCVDPSAPIRLKINATNEKAVGEKRTAETEGSRE